MCVFGSAVILCGFTLGANRVQEVSLNLPGRAEGCVQWRTGTTEETRTVCATRPGGSSSVPLGGVPIAVFSGHSEPSIPFLPGLQARRDRGIPPSTAVCGPS